MEKPSSSSSNNTSSLNLLDIFSLCIVVDLIRNISCSFMSSLSLFHAKFQFFGSSKVIMSEHKSNTIDVRNNKKDVSTSSNDELNDDDCLYGRDINMVMERLGVQHRFEGEEQQKKWGCAELSGLFEEEPSLEEVKEAFGVFDQNKDGFIDEEELQRVLCALGLSQGLELQDCRRMIMGFDQNNDGKMDFNVFVGFMLNNI